MSDASRRAVRATLVVVAITALAGYARFHGLGLPDEKVFDEVYYASDGCWYAGLDPEACGLEDDREQSWVHPPLGKIMIGWGIDAFGNDPFGWRFSAAVAGTLAVALGGILAFLLTSSPAWAGIGALLVGTEHLLFVQSRIAMLDVFLALLVLLGLVLLVWDRRRNLLDAAPEPTTPPPPGDATEDAWLDQAPEDQGWLDEPVDEAPAAPGGLRPLRFLAGAAFGAAVAVKWSGVLALVAGVLLATAWERSDRRARGVRRPLRRALAEGWPSLLLGLVVVPLLVYSLAWSSWFLREPERSVGSWIGHHQAMADYHFGLSTEDEDGEPIHPYMSRAPSWLLLLRPVAYFFESGSWGQPSATAREILGIGSPLLFWGGLVVIPYLLLAWFRRRDWRYGAVLVPLLLQYLPWLAVSRPLFLFYMTPVTPLLALGMLLAVRDLGHVRIRGRRIMAAAPAVLVAVAVALFAFFWPVLTARTLSADAWQTRIWLGSWV